MSPHLPRPAAACAVYFLLHIAAHLSAAWFEAAPGISVWYPPSGLALSLLVLLGPRFAPVVFAANVAGAAITPGVSSAWDPWLFPLLITASHTGAAWLVRRAIGAKLLPGTTRETLVFILTMTVAPAVTALIGTAAARVLGFVTPTAFLSSCVRWWVGDASGLLTIVPVAMVFAPAWLDPRGRASAGRRGDRRLWGVVAAQAALLIGCLVLAFAVEPLPRYNAFYLCFLPLVWICLRHGLPGATLATLAITMGSLIGMHVIGSSTELIVNFLFFELTVAVVGLGLGSAVTRRNEVKRELVASEARLERVIAGAKLGLWDWDVPAQRVAYNVRCAEMLNCALSQLEAVDATWRQLAHPDDREAIATALQAHLDGRSPLYEIEYRVRAGDAQGWRWMHSRGSVVARDDRGRPLLVSGTHLDITDRKHAEAEARRLLQLIDATTDFILTTDRNGRILFLNTALLRLLGVDDAAALRGRVLRDALPAPAVETMQREAMPAALHDGAWHGELILHDAAGAESPVSLVALAQRDENENAATISFVMRDISRQRRAEAEKLENERKLLQLQKTESLGLLAGGVAHDFNNLLTTMLGNANLARLKLAPESAALEPISHIETAARRAANLCHQMLAYAGRSPLSLAEVDLTPLIEDTQKLLQVSIGKKIEVALQLAHPLAPVRAARTQMQQVIMNLALNASEAIGDAEGRIAIRTSSRHFSAAELREQFDAAALTEGEHVLLEVEDTGRGIPPEIRSRIFEPFFTTKFTGHGLGLAAVHGIVRAHHGAIHVISTPGRGSTFRILLPAIKVAAPRTIAPERPTNEWRGSGLVLIVDDEPSVRQVTACLLRNFGFTTVLASDGREGVEQFRAHAHELQLVLLDLTMPRMDGGEAFAEMTRIDPTVPVILMSGYSEKLTTDRFVGKRPAGFLAKPFDLPTLRGRLQLLPRRVTPAPAG